MPLLEGSILKQNLESLLDERYKYSNEANRLKFYLDVIKSTYGIEVAIRNNAVYFTPSVVDSALRIYPFFKKYARFNPDGSVTIHLKEQGLRLAGWVWVSGWFLYGSWGEL